MNHLRDPFTEFSHCLLQLQHIYFLSKPFKDHIQGRRPWDCPILWFQVIFTVSCNSSIGLQRYRIRKLEFVAKTQVILTINNLYYGTHFISNFYILDGLDSNTEFMKKDFQTSNNYLIKSIRKSYKMRIVKLLTVLKKYNDMN